ncbi:hypothetical protein RHOSPDRAFT_32710 [Rhodotorula sp. JG-1b]|nr:hypothetical protein RHOSPDRAFT_32710 [Rhodotorula sp. JG-1b]
MSSAYRQGGLLHRDPNRTALFGSRSSSPLPMYNKPSDRYAADRTADDIQGQNDEALEGLSQKVKLLKNITINIGNEVRDSTKMMNGMASPSPEFPEIQFGCLRASS